MVDTSPASNANLGRTGIWAAGSFLVIKSHTAENLTLWASDGTTAGTTAILEVPSRSRIGNAHVVVDGVVYFPADTDFATNRSTEIWKTDGDAANTVKVADVENRIDSIDSDSFVASGTHVYFTVAGHYDGSGGLFVFDTVSGETRQIRSGDEIIYGVRPFGDGVAFSASDPQHGTELWTSDGRVAGTQLLADINADGASQPYGLTSIGDEVLFAADDEIYGTDGPDVILHFGGDGNDLAKPDCTETFNVP